MQAPNEKISHLSQLASIHELMDSNKVRLLRHMLNNLTPADIPAQIEAAPPKARRALWDLVDKETNTHLEFTKKIKERINFNQLMGFITKQFSETRVR